MWVVSAAGINQPVPRAEKRGLRVYARVSSLGRETATGVQVRYWDYRSFATPKTDRILGNTGMFNALVQREQF